MLELWLCTNRKENTTRMLDAISQKAKQGIGGQFLLVPEQFSHMAERALCQRGGDKISRFAEVLGFSRLATRVFSVEGGCAESETDAIGQLLIMALAVEQVHSRLKIYGKSVTKPEFLLSLLETFDEFRSYCISPNQLRGVSASLSGVLAQKTEEFALLMESCEAVTAQLGQNPETRLSRLCRALEGSEFCKDKIFYLDGFTDFNGAELEVLAQLLNCNSHVIVALQCDSLDARSQQFTIARQTAKSLIRIAQQQNVAHKLAQWEPIKDETPFSFLRKKLFSGVVEPYVHSQNQISLISAPDEIAQCRIAVGEIMHLVSCGVRWRNISIVCPNYSLYRPILESLLRRAEIPSYFAGDTGLLQHSVIHTLLSVLEATTGSMETESVLAYLKSDYSPLDREACDRMENYLYLWHISGNRWENPWTMHPDGLNGRDTEESRLRLQELESNRVLAIQPLIQLRKSLLNSHNTGEMVLALSNFLEEIDLSNRLNTIATMEYEAGRLQSAQEYVQLYILICKLLEQVYGVLGNTIRTPDNFHRIIKVALSQSSIGTIPATLDCVSVGNLLSQRRCDTDYVFLLGAEEGSFPGMRSGVQLLTDSDRSNLLALGVNISQGSSQSLDRELSSIDSVLCAPEKHLYFGACKGKEAYLLRRIWSIFQELPCLQNDSELIAHSEKDYLSYLVENQELLSIAKKETPVQAIKAQELISAAEYSLSSLSNETVRGLYGDNLRLSATKIDRLSECQFAYFMEYGLKAKERETAEANGLVYGTFVHDVLEYTVKQVMQEGGFHMVPLERVLQLAQERMEFYVKEVLRDLWDSVRAEYLFRRNFAEIRAVVESLYDELQGSAFEPKWFELRFADNGILPAVKIVGEKVVSELVGSVDRADIWRHEGRTYVRVIDYKTNSKDFTYTKVFNGINLQMLLYLFALEKIGKGLENSPLSPAGVLYHSAKIKDISLPDKLSQSELKKKQRQASQHQGMILNSDPVLQAMEVFEEEPRFLPVTVGKNGVLGGYLYSFEQFRSLEDYVFRLISKLGDTLYSGEIYPNPICFSNTDKACKYCRYITVCRNHQKERWVSSLNKDEFWEKVGEKECH